MKKVIILAAAAHPLAGYELPTQIVNPFAAPLATINANPLAAVMPRLMQQASQAAEHIVEAVEEELEEGERKWGQWRGGHRNVANLANSWSNAVVDQLLGPQNRYFLEAQAAYKRGTMTDAEFEEWKTKLTQACPWFKKMQQKHDDGESDDAFPFEQALAAMHANKVAKVERAVANKLAEGMERLGMNGHGVWQGDSITKPLLGQDGHGVWQGDKPRLGQNGHGVWNHEDTAEKPRYGRDGHGVWQGDKKAEKPLLGQDGHGVWQNPFSMVHRMQRFGKDGHGVWNHGNKKAEKPLLGQDGHGVWQGDKPLLGQDGHGVWQGDNMKKPLLGQDGHGVWQGDNKKVGMPLLGQGGHGVWNHEDTAEKPRYGRDGHGVWNHDTKKPLLGQDGHGVWQGDKPRLGQDGHGVWQGDKPRLGQNGHGVWNHDTKKPLLGQDGHGVWQGNTPLLGQDGHGVWHHEDTEEKPRYGQDGHGVWQGDTPLLGQNGHGVWQGDTPAVGKIGSVGPEWTFNDEVEAPAGTKDMGGWTAGVYTAEQQARFGVDELGARPAPRAFGKIGSVGPEWTFNDEVEVPTGTKDMGGWTAGVYTAEQQARFGVDELGALPGTTARSPPADVAGVKMPTPRKPAGSVGPAWTHGGDEAPAGTKDMGGWSAGVYTAEQQARLGVDESGTPVKRAQKGKNKGKGKGKKRTQKDEASGGL